MLAAAPVVDGDVLDSGHPAAAVVAQAPGVLEARPPVAVALDLDETWGSAAALGDQVDKLILQRSARWWTTRGSE